MNIDNIKVRSIFKNYTHLCEAIEEKPKAGGKSKKLHIEDISRHFSFIKQGQKFIIIEIYNKPIAKMDKRTNGNNSIYLTYIEPILVDFLFNRVNQQCEITTKRLAVKLAFANNDYIEKENYDDSVYQQREFYRRTHQKFKDTIDSALNKLKKQEIIDYSNEYKIVFKINNKENHVTASIQEKKDIENIKLDVAKSMDCDNVAQVHLKFKTKEFYDKVNTIFKENFDWDYCYSYYYITLISKLVNTKDKNDIYLLKIELNNLMLEAINEQAEKNYAKNMSKNQNTNNWGSFYDFEGKNFVLSDDYVETQKEFANRLIKIDTLKT